MLRCSCSLTLGPQCTEQVVVVPYGEEKALCKCSQNICVGTLLKISWLRFGKSQEGRLPFWSFTNVSLMARRWDIHAIKKAACFYYSTVCSRVEYETMRRTLTGVGLSWDYSHSLSSQLLYWYLIKMLWFLVDLEKTTANVRILENVKCTLLWWRDEGLGPPHQVYFVIAVQRTPSACPLVWMKEHSFPCQKSCLQVFSAVLLRIISLYSIHVWVGWGFEVMCTDDYPSQHSSPSFRVISWKGGS